MILGAGCTTPPSRELRAPDYEFLLTTAKSNSPQPKSYHIPDRQPPFSLECKDCAETKQIHWILHEEHTINKPACVHNANLCRGGTQMHRCQRQRVLNSLSFLRGIPMWRGLMEASGVRSQYFQTHHNRSRSPIWMHYNSHQELQKSKGSRAS